jgi:GT2 family glycosyltransferase
MGAAIAGKKSTFTSLGGWDEKFFLYYEDSDICYRANALGLPITVIGDCRWVHGWARETKGINLRAWRYELKSMLRFYRIYRRELFRIR